MNQLPFIKYLYGRHILIVDDDSNEIDLISEILAPLHCHITSAPNGEEGLFIAVKDRPELILMDVIMPGVGGITACKRLNEHPLTKDIPIIIISANSTIQTLSQAFQVGAVDFIRKPVEPLELQVRLDAAFRQKNTIDELKKTQKDLDEKNQKLETLSITDSLTGVYNRRHFDYQFNHSFSLYKRYKIPVGCIIIDIDNFKQINDTFGHRVGDQVLIGLCRIIKSSIRDADIVARLGGEEFGLLTPNCNESSTFGLAKRLETLIRAALFVPEHENLKVTVSQGVSELCETDQYDEVIKRADQALYKAKAEGKNQVIIWTP